MRFMSNSTIISVNFPYHLYVLSRLDVLETTLISFYQEFNFETWYGIFESFGVLTTNTISLGTIGPEQRL